MKGFEAFEGNRRELKKGFHNKGKCVFQPWGVMVESLTGLKSMG